MQSKCQSEVADRYFDNAVSSCPRPLNCTELIQLSGYESTIQERWPSIVAIVSCTISVLGSLLIIYTYARWRDLRTGSRSIITYLAIADLFTALGYIAGSLNYLVHYGEDNTENCKKFDTVCQIQSFVTTTSSLSSFAWTLFLALYLFLVIVRGNIAQGNKLIPLFHVIAWGCPLLITLPLLITGRLGYSPYAASNWCFIRDYLPGDRHIYVCGDLNYEGLLLVLVAGKAWEIITYFLIIAIYTIIKCHMHKEAKSSYQFFGETNISALQRADKKLTFIPLVFILLRVWGTAQFIFASSAYRETYYSCVPREYGIVFSFFAYLQAVGDGGQGWGNLLLYVISSPKIRERLGQCLCHPSWCNVVGSGCGRGQRHTTHEMEKGRKDTGVSVNDTTTSFTPSLTLQ